MKRERWEQTPLCSLCPGPFFFFSIPIQCRLEKTNKQLSAYCSRAWSGETSSCEVGGALCVPIVYPLPTQIMGMPGKGNSSSCDPKGLGKPSSPLRCISCLAGAQRVLCKGRCPISRANKPGLGHEGRRCLLLVCASSLT